MFLVDVYKDFKDFSSKNSIVLSLVYILIFIYPLFVLSIRDWSSGIYSILCLIAIGYLFKKSECVYPQEVRVYSWIVFLFFISILISSTLNNWTESSYSRLGTEAKILVFIPFFLLVFKNAQLRKFLVYSIPLAAVILGTHGILDVFVFNDPYADSAYGKIITGDISGLFVGLSGVIFLYTKDETIKKICIAAIILSTITCVLSTSRNGWIVLSFNILFLVFLDKKNNKKSILSSMMALGMAVTLVVGVFIASNNNIIKPISEFKDYFSHSDKTQLNIASSSAGTRLEQWRVALIAFPDKPIFGAGPGNSSIVINEYIKKGIAHPDLYHPRAETDMGHVHNQYIDTLLVQGIVGLILILLIIFYPAWVFIKNYYRNELYANMGLVLVASYSIASLTEIPFVSDNFTSIFFVFMAVFLSNVIESKREV